MALRLGDNEALMLNTRQTPKTSSTGGAFATPLRYPGGKGRLGPWLAQVLAYNQLEGGWYVEPYAGGAGAALYLLVRQHVDHIVINDADPVVYAFWRAVTEETYSLINLMRSTPVTMRSWERQRAILDSPLQHDFVQLGFAAFFLNRTNRSGILSAGVIGGRAQSGTWKLDTRFNVEQLVERIERIGSLSNHITVTGMDALDLLIDAAPGFPDQTLVYLDPPYFEKGCLLYRNHYEIEDHADIASILDDANYPLIVTYDDCAEIRNLYRRFESTQFSLQYSTTHLARPKASEMLFYRNVELPFAPAMTRGYDWTPGAAQTHARGQRPVL